MRILTLGDSWTFGAESSDPATMSWPAQMSRKYNVEVVNLARSGSSNKRAMRIGIEELCRDSKYDAVVLPLGPASRTEVLINGKWRQVWPGANTKGNELDRIYTESWLPWNDVQETIIQTFYFVQAVRSFGIPVYVFGLSLNPYQYINEISWITNYKDDNDFNSLGMPLQDLNIGIKDLDRKLKSLRAIHKKNLEVVPEYLNDITTLVPYTCRAPGGHPNDDGYAMLADYFAEKIGISG